MNAVAYGVFNTGTLTNKFRKLLRGTGLNMSRLDVRVTMVGQRGTNMEGKPYVALDAPKALIEDEYGVPVDRFAVSIPVSTISNCTTMNLKPGDRCLLNLKMGSLTPMKD